VPNIRSAKKDMRKSRAAAIRNRAQRSALRTALKKSLAPTASADERTSAVSLLDRAARKGLIHPNKAARHKSQIARGGSRRAGFTPAIRHQQRTRATARDGGLTGGIG
jgi:small subunit ribosomal protein S20